MGREYPRAWEPGQYLQRDGPRLAEEKVDTQRFILHIEDDATVLKVGMNRLTAKADVRLITRAGVAG